MKKLPYCVQFRPSPPSPLRAATILEITHSQRTPAFRCRFYDVQKLFGIKRGTLYNFAAEGLVKSVCLRRRGNVKGVRLFYLQSVSDYLHKLMEQQNGQRDGELNGSDPGL